MLKIRELLRKQNLTMHLFSYVFACCVYYFETHRICISNSFAFGAYTYAFIIAMPMGQ